MNRICIFTFTIVCVLVSACEYSAPVATDNVKATPNEINLEKIMVVGDTYASGFMDGVLTTRSKKESYTGILRKHLNSELGVEIEVDTDSSVISTQNLELFKNGNNNSGAFLLDYKTKDFIYPSQVTDQAQIGYTHTHLGEYVDATFAGLNSYEIVAENPLVSNNWASQVYTNVSTLGEIINEQDPGLILVQIGQSDLVNAALSGVSGKFEVLEENANPNDLISSGEFERIVEVLVQDLLSQTNGQIVLFSLFDPLKAPYFQTLDYAFEPEIYSSRYVGGLAGYYSNLNEKIAEYHLENDITFFDARPQVDFDTENWPNTSKRFRAKMTEDEYLPTLETNDGYEIPQIRMMVEDELVLYKNLAQLDEDSDFGGIRPLTDDEAITIVESDSLRLFLNEWNTILTNVADDSPRIHMLNMNRIMLQIEEQTLGYEGVFYTNDFTRRSIFSADGYTLSARGNAVIANEIISLINVEFSTQFSQINPNKFRGLNYRIK